MNIIKDIEITLYDIFGYLIPGSVALIGIYLIAWRVVLPPNQDWTDASARAWVVVLGLAYVMGHFVQALSNLIFRSESNGPTERVLRVPGSLAGCRYPVTRGERGIYPKLAFGHGEEGMK